MELTGAVAMLDGIRVIELGTVITAPLTGMMLGDFGADVIKVERPKGDPFRRSHGDADGPTFVAYNRNKRSIVLDLTAEQDRKVLHGFDWQRGRIARQFPAGRSSKARTRARRDAEALPPSDPMLDYRLWRHRTVQQPTGIRCGRTGAQRHHQPFCRSGTPGRIWAYYF